jgi:hypothetical protein
MYDAGVAGGFFTNELLRVQSGGVCVAAMSSWACKELLVRAQNDAASAPY